MTATVSTVEYQLDAAPPLMASTARAPPSTSSTTTSHQHHHHHTPPPQMSSAPPTQISAPRPTPSCTPLPHLLDGGGSGSHQPRECRLSIRVPRPSLQSARNTGLQLHGLNKHSRMWRPRTHVNVMEAAGSASASAGRTITNCEFFSNGVINKLIFNFDRLCPRSTQLQAPNRPGTATRAAGAATPQQASSARGAATRQIVHSCLRHCCCCHR